MKYKFLALMLIVSYGAVSGQEALLSGRVTDSDGYSIVGANVILEGNAIPDGKTGTVTSQEGDFRIENLPAGAYRLRITHIGYRDLVREKIEIVTGGVLELELELEAELIFLEQNVVSASRRQEKILEAPASVAVVEAREIRDRPSLSVVEHIRDLPAVDFSQTGLAQSNVVVRGFNNIFSGALLTLTDNRIARVPSLRLNAYNFIRVTN